MRKRTVKPLPEPQKQTLLEMYRHHPKLRMRERAHMVLLSSQGRNMKEICSMEMIRGQGFTLIRPRHKTIVPTLEQIAETNNKTFHYLEKARLGEILLFYLDETPATLWSTLSYVWARKGTRPEIPMADDHGHVYVFSAANPLNGKVH